MFKRNKLAMLVAEFLGTGILTLAVLSVQRSQLGLAYFVAIAAGLTTVALTYAFGTVSGAHFNPALTLALWTARRVKTIPAILFIVVQLLGAWAAYGLYKYFVNTDVQTVHQAFSGRIMVAEAIGAMVFSLAWASAAYNRYETARFAAVAGIGFIIAIIIASAASVGLANPALALGARAWAVFGENGWLNYAVGPALGAVIGVNLYGLLFAEPDGPFSFVRRRSTAAKVSSVSSTSSSVVDEDATVSDDDELDDDDDDVESIVAPIKETSEAEDPDEAIDIDKAVNKNAKLGTVAPRSSVKVTRAKKSGARKTSTRTTKKKR